MTFVEFLSILNGEYKEEAGTDAKFQCVDSANAYIKYVLGLPIIAGTNAKDFPARANPADYDYILNTPNGVPKEGDIVVWGGTYGHVAVFIEGDTNSFRSFDQNYPTGTPCHVQSHTYTSPKVLGWLHPKNPPLSIDQELQTCINDRNSHWDWLIKIADKLGVAVHIDIIMAELNKFLSYEEALRTTTENLEVKTQEITVLNQKIEAITREKDELSLKITEAQKINTEQQTTIDKQSEILKENAEVVRLLAGRIDMLKSEIADLLSKSIGSRSGLEIIWIGIKTLFGYRG